MRCMEQTSIVAKSAIYRHFCVSNAFAVSGPAWLPMSKLLQADMPFLHVYHAMPSYLRPRRVKAARSRLSFH